MTHLRRHTAYRCLALLALALQALLAFGHTHGLLAHGLQARGLQVRHVGSALACRTFLPPSAEHPCPVPHQDKASCAICWTVAQAGSLTHGEPPQLPLPALASESLSLERDRAGHTPAKTAAFDARGPPTAAAI